MKAEELKKIILKMFRDKKFYGYEVHKQLTSENIKIEISYLYRVLNEMLKERLLESSWEKSRSGPKKRVYWLGKKGKEELNKILMDAIKTVHIFYKKYVTSLPANVNVFNSMGSLLTKNLKEKVKIAYITSNYSVMHEKLIGALNKKVPQGKLYFVKPDSMQVDLKFNNLSFLDGAYNNIPLKENYLDLLVVTGVPKKDSFIPALKEWHRVLKQTGRLTILTPTVFIRKYEDPLTIGDFIEKHEHQTKEKTKQISREDIHGILKKFFNKVEERRIVHITIFLATEPYSHQQ